MSRIRQVKGSFFKDDALFDAERTYGLPNGTVRLGYEGLWGQADCRGVFAWKAKELKLDILPYDDVDFERVLEALAAIGKVVKYEVDGRTYGFIPNLKAHQHFHKDEKPSKLPDPPPQNPVLAPGIHPASTGPAPGQQDASTPCCLGSVAGDQVSVAGDLGKAAAALEAKTPWPDLADFPLPSSEPPAEPTWLATLTLPAQTLIRGQLRSRTAERAFALVCDLHTLFPDQDPGNQHHATDEISEGIIACINLGRPLTGKTVRNLIQAARRDAGRPPPTGDQDEFQAAIARLKPEERRA